MWGSGNEEQCLVMKLGVVGEDEERIGFGFASKFALFIREVRWVEWLRSFFLLLYMISCAFNI